MLALNQIAQHVQKTYIFTDLKGSLTYLCVQWYKEPLFIDQFKYLSSLVPGVHYHFVLPAPGIELWLPA